MYVVNKRPQLKLYALSAIRILIANSRRRWRGIFQGLSQDGGRTDFYKNLPDFLFYKDLSNEPNFNRIHLARQYL